MSDEIRERIPGPYKQDLSEEGCPMCTMKYYKEGKHYLGEQNIFTFCETHLGLILPKDEE